MTKKYCFGLLLCGLFWSVAFSQNNNETIQLKIKAQFGDKALILDEKYVSKKDTLELSTLKFYLTSIEFDFADGTQFKEKESCHLVDVADANSMVLRFPTTNKKINAIRFSIGVDSLASTSGALSGDLDPAKGMYWAWQSGYINFKMEGKCQQCPTRKNKFQFHIGGYKMPYYAMRTKEFTIRQSGKEINLVLDLASFFDAVNLKEINTVMSPSAKSMELADAIALLFRME